MQTIFVMVKCELGKAYDALGELANAKLAYEEYLANLDVK